MAEKCDGDVPEKYVPGWLDQLDGRYAVAKDVRSRFVQLTQNLGGVESLSYQQRSLCERSVWFEFWLAKQERELAEGKDFAIGLWTQANNSLLGLYRHLGITRRARKAETLAEYAARIATEDQSGGRSVA